MDTTFLENWHALSNACCRKNRKPCSLPVVEQWEEYVVTNHLRFPAIIEKDFRSCTLVMAALDKVANQYLQTEIRRDVRHFLEEFVNCLLSTVALRLLIGQDNSWFCPAMVVGGDNTAPIRLFN